MKKLIRPNRPKRDQQRNDQDDNDMAVFSANELKESNKAKRDFYWTNLRIDNHQRNFLQALKNLGYAKSQKEALGVLITSYEKNINNEQRSKIKELFDALETADRINKLRN